MKRNYYFYVLKDPKTFEIRYFGKTINLNKRLKDHIYESKNCNTHKCNWIKSINFNPIIQCVFFQECTIKESSKIEKTILRKLMKKFNLTNSWDNCIGAFKTGKLVHQYDLKGNFIKTFENATHAESETDVYNSNILRSCKKSGPKGMVSAGNYLWLFKKYKKYPYPLKRNNGEKPIIQYDLNGNYIKEFISAREASKKLNINYKLISRVCRGKRNKTCGYKFKFKT